MTSTVKSNTRHQFESLLETVERLRKEKFPNLDAGLVQNILRLHSDGGAASSEITREVEQATEHFLTGERRP